ncbi:DUF4191 domain-containing protein [Corynebacterium liangguodongii]|uniref:DUF4191 domain-containing protein n=1 Tax=Corynebacterium liangguodongii TaxID=2079535 RepID=A0A2S0WF37_9CORY|nr:DUF4191 domain-containing protein [Corynebacterium liangguodongii]AWB84395.1 DUF4191 domain-containing protein [Corynebacterium liangguodongii]PWB99885.1 DUF4191 domain-containing protein [Corynebacterium liangguodongii]
MANPKDKAAAKAAKQEERAAKRAKRKDTRGQLVQAFNLQRKRDKALIPLMVLSVVGVAALFFLIGLLFNGQWFMLVMGLIAGAILAMIIFSRRLERSMYEEVGNTPGAAAWTLENMRSTLGIVWLTKPAVAANQHMDTVHRVVGNPGVVLVGEGDPARLKQLMNREHKRVNRLLAGVPIHEVYVGDGEGQTHVRDLQKTLLKLPKNYRKDDVYTMSAKLDAMDARTRPGQPAGLPGGPLPRGAQSMSGMNRKMRRMQERKGK